MERSETIASTVMEPLGTTLSTPSRKRYDESSRVSPLHVRRNKIDDHYALPPGITHVFDRLRLAELWELTVKDTVFGQYLLSPDNYFLEMGDGDGVYYVIDVAHRNRADVGIILFTNKYKGRDALPIHKQMLNYAFQALNVDRLGGKIRTDNRIAHLIARRLGFKREGTLRCYSNGEDYDSYSLLRGD